MAKHRAAGTAAIFCVMASFMSQPAAMATNYSWVGGFNNSSWTDATKWNPNTGFPSSSADSASFPVGGAVKFDGTFNVGSLSLSQMTSLILTGDAAGPNASLNVTSSFASNPAQIDFTSTDGPFNVTLSTPASTFFNDGQIRILPGTGGARTFTVTNLINDGGLSISANAFVGKSGSGTLQNGILGLGSVAILPSVTLSTNQYVQQGNATTQIEGTLDVLTGPIKFTGGTLIGSGTFNDPATFVNTAIKPRSNIVPNGFVTPGTMTINGNASLGNGVDLDILLGAPGTASVLAVNGNLDLTGTGTILALSGGTIGTSYIIATYEGTLTDTFDIVSPGYVVDYSHIGEIRVFVPEPAAGTIFAGCGLLALARRRKRR